MYTQNSLPTDGTIGPFPIGFNYLSGATIRAVITDLDGSNASEVAFTFAGTKSDAKPEGTTINLAVAEPSGKLLVIEKVVSLDTPVIVWNAGAEVSQKNLRSTTTNLMEMVQTSADLSDALADRVVVTEQSLGVVVADATAAIALAEAQAAIAIAKAAEAAATLTTMDATLDAAVASATDDAYVSKLAAEAALDAVLDAYNNFDDRYLGSKAVEPTVDNDGDALVSGTLYYNSVEQVMRLYTGSAWVAAYVSGAGVLAAVNNLSDLSDALVARGNLGLVIGTDVQAYDADTAKLDVAQTWAATQVPKFGSLTDAASISWDGAANGQVVSCTATAMRAFAAPTNIVQNATYILVLASGGFQHTFDAAFKWPEATAPDLIGTCVLSFVGGAGNTLLAPGLDVR